MSVQPSATLSACGRGHIDLTQRAAVYHGPNKLEIADVPEPAPAPRIQGSLCYTAADFEAVIALMAQGAYDTDGWVTEIAIDDVTGRGIRGAACGHEDEGAGRSGRAMTLNGKLGLVGAVPDGISGGGWRSGVIGSTIGTDARSARA